MCSSQFLKVCSAIALSNINDHDTKPRAVPATSTRAAPPRGRHDHRRRRLSLSGEGRAAVAVLLKADWIRSLGFSWKPPTMATRDWAPGAGATAMQHSRNSTRRNRAQFGDKAGDAPSDFTTCAETKAAWRISAAMYFDGTQPLSRTQSIALLISFAL